MKRKLLKGFTLIELMIVVAIVAILAAVAIPAYQNYTARSQLSEVFSFADNAKTTVTTFIQTGNTSGITSLSDAAVGINPNTSGEYVTGVQVSGALTAPVITVTFANTTAGSGSVTFSGTVGPDGQTITWFCSASVPQQYLPSSCTTGGAGPMANQVAQGVDIGAGTEVANQGGANNVQNAGNVQDAGNVQNGGSVNTQGIITGPVGAGTGN